MRCSDLKAGLLSRAPATDTSSLKHDRFVLVETSVSVYLFESALESAGRLESLRESDRGEARMQAVQGFGV